MFLILQTGCERNVKANSSFYYVFVVIVFMLAVPLALELMASLGVS